MGVLEVEKSAGKKARQAPATTIVERTSNKMMVLGDVDRLVKPSTYATLERDLQEMLEARPELGELVFKAWTPRSWRKRPGRTRHYPQGVIPIHSIPPPKRRLEDDSAEHSRRHWRRIRRMVLQVESEGAGQFPPILVHQGQLITGTHRWVANELLERRGRTEERIGVVELQNYPTVVQFVIRLLFNSGEHTKTQPAFHLMVGIPLDRNELAIQDWLDPAVWDCCDIDGKPVYSEVI